MNRIEFLEILEKKILFLDGAYGSEFIARGYSNIIGERLVLEKPEAVYQLHKDYVEAGADILLSCTFSANRVKLLELGLLDKLKEINTKAVKLALDAAQSESTRKNKGIGKDGRALVFGNISSTGNFPAPFGTATMEELISVYAEQALVLDSAGCDGFLIETMTDIKELKAAVWGIREVTQDKPIIAHLTFDSMGRTMTGTSVEVFSATLQDLDVDVLGMNCELDPEAMLQPLQKLVSCCKKPISVEPNAGMPRLVNGKAIYDMSAESYAPWVEDLADHGASIIGGCCGTSPKHIELMTKLLGSRVKRNKKLQSIIGPSSRTELAIKNQGAESGGAESESLLIVGERINPASRKAFQKELNEGNMTTLLDEALAQASEGANVLDINFGIENSISKDFVRDVIIALDKMSAKPLSLDIQSLELLETALKEYAGRALINSTSANEADLIAKTKLVKKYGGTLVVLAMEKKVSDKAEERVESALKAVSYLENNKIDAERLYIDPLALSVGTGKNPEVTLQTLRLLRDKGYKTICGLSNISFGMPEREGINAAFLSRAMDSGLNAAIMNSAEKSTMNVMAGSVLLKYGRIEHEKKDEIKDPLVKALALGRKKEVNRLLDEELKTKSPLEVSQGVLAFAMEEIGRLYENKKIYLPELLFASECAIPEFARLGSSVNTSASNKGLVLLATVEGDIHDIGKNIISVVLQSSGYVVKDLGKDVKANEIVKAVREYKPLCVGLSAMMTTTVMEVLKVKELLVNENNSVPVLAGGASMSDALGKQFGVYYAKNGSECLRIVKEFKDAV